MDAQDFRAALETTPIETAVDQFFAFLEQKFPQYSILLKGANGVIDFVLTKEGL